MQQTWGMMISTGQPQSIHTHAHTDARTHTLTHMSAYGAQRSDGSVLIVVFKTAFSEIFWKSGSKSMQPFQELVVGNVSYEE